MSLKWTEKYRPGSLSEVAGNNKAVSELREWAGAWEDGRPITKAAIIYGPAGTGKTSAALALAREMGWDYIEMNASDARTAGAIERIAGPAASSGTFSGGRRLVILDEADNLHGSADRGGAAAMLRLVRAARQPVLLIANEYYEIDRALREAAKGIQFRSIREPTVAAKLREICKAEEIACDPDALVLIAERAGGDMRSAVNDLQAASEGSADLNLDDVATAERDVKPSIFKALETIFKGENSLQAADAARDLDESPEDLIHWIDENLPAVYQGDDLKRAYEALTRADIFLGRVRRRQNYGLWRYASFMMTGGVQAARSRRRGGYVAFRPPGNWRRLGTTKKARQIRDSAASKIARHLHVSRAFTRMELMDFVGLLIQNKRIAPRVAAELDLNVDEIALLMGSTPTTKKVQSIFEEAQALRAAEETEEIEAAFGGSSLARRVASAQMSAQRPEPGIEDAVEAVETPRETPAVSTVARTSAKKEEAKKPEGKRRGRPRKADKADKIEKGAGREQTDGGEAETRGERKEPGRGQKSLFEF